MKPENANPKNFTVSRIVYTAPDGSFSIAKGEWTEDNMNRFAMRWNGDINNPSDKGYPSVFDNPMWFQLPYDIKDILRVLIENSNEMVL
jgi:hypothetical protein